MIFGYPKPATAGLLPALKMRLHVVRPRVKKPVWLRPTLPLKRRKYLNLILPPLEPKYITTAVFGFAISVVTDPSESHDRDPGTRPRASCTPAARGLTPRNTTAPILQLTFQIKWSVLDQQLNQVW